MLTAEVSLRRLDAHMAEQKLNLLKLPAGCVIQPSTCAAKVVRSNTFETAFRTPGLHHAPDNLGTESIVPNSLGLIDGAKYRTRRDSGGGHPVGVGGRQQEGGQREGR